MIENEMTVSVPLEVVKASEIEPKEVKWLWYPYGSKTRQRLPLPQHAGGVLFEMCNISNAKCS